VRSPPTTRGLLLVVVSPIVFMWPVFERLFYRELAGASTRRRRHSHHCRFRSSTSRVHTARSVESPDGHRDPRYCTESRRFRECRAPELPVLFLAWP